jgi:hypothetical protein
VRERCRYPCDITSDKSNLPTADIIIYHAPSHKRNTIAVKKTEAINLMVCLEQPKYTPLIEDFAYLKSHFDLIMTYATSKMYAQTGIAHIPVSYFPLEIYSPQRLLTPPPKSFSEKTGYGTGYLNHVHLMGAIVVCIVKVTVPIGVSVVVFTSNCEAAGASDRKAYLEELMKYIKVHSYGKCLNNAQEPAMPYDDTVPGFNQRKARKIHVLSNYKFYLAFENAPIEDYVSEKVIPMSCPQYYCKPQKLMVE